MANVDLSVRVGNIELPSPILTASGTAGYGDEFVGYIDFEKLGAHVTKSVTVESTPGNPAPRVAELQIGMINSIGLPGPGIDAWMNDYLPKVLPYCNRIVASIWGFTFEAYEKVASALSAAPPEVIAVEINVSCPNTERSNQMFAQSAEDTRALVQLCVAANRPLWAKLTPAVSNIVEIAGAAYEGGAEAVVLTNTMPAMSIDIEKGQYVLGAGERGGGLSGAALHPIAIRAVHDVRRAFPNNAIVGVGGVSNSDEVVEFLMAGANAVEVGTATFADPRAVNKIREGLIEWCEQNKINHVSDLVGAIHDKHGN